MSVCQALWGDSEVGWELQPAANTTGGLLCLWSEEDFKVHSKVIGSGFILLVGQWLKEAQQLKNSHNGGLWCILGDFNNVRNPSKRISRCQRREADNSIKEFNEWIEDLEVKDAPWMGRKFTWYRPNGSAKSKLDRFLVSPEWITKWPATKQCTLDRNFSDHCLIILRSKVIDWGPQPFRVLDSWLLDISFIRVVHDCWSST
ncbi:hypothetical protein GmHk_14G042037 [Glycine max]|nr:hypothetical protein GmHk_14G042037 [Glycine max]